ncbi:MAG TPA: Crp/Fnr family transcriptional regulator [bacterium]|nr:Crp/Fnr family transcriptional regulator [bacterium]
MAMDLLSNLAQVPAFAGAAPEHLVGLAGGSQLRRFRPREIITQTPGAREECHLVLNGRVKLSARARNGHPMFLHVCRPRELFFSEQFLRSGGPQIEAEALEATQIVSISQATMQRFLQHHPPTCGRLLLQEAALKGILLDRLSEIVSLHVPERLGRFLVCVGKRYGTKRADVTVHLDLGLTHQELANSIGTSRETATTLINELKAKGLLTVGRKTITLLDLAALEQIGVDPARVSLATGTTTRHESLLPVSTPGAARVPAPTAR